MKKNVTYLQLMATGLSGPVGVRVTSHVETEQGHVTGHAVTQPPLTVDWRVRGFLLRS